MADLWSPRPVKSSERLLARRVLERVADARDDLVARCLVARIGERRLGVARMLLALIAQLLDQGVAIGVEAGVRRRGNAGRLGRLGDRRIELALSRQPQRYRVLGRDVRHV